MRIANVGNMKLFFEAYMKHDGDWGVPQLAELNKLFRSADNSTHINNALVRVDSLLHGHGVEYTQNAEQDVVAMYVNMGDTYNATIIYDCLAGKFYVGTWGDWVEWRSKNKDYNLCQD